MPRRPPRQLVENAEGIRWVCRDAHEREQFRDWTIRKLDEYWEKVYEPKTDRDFQLMVADEPDRDQSRAMVVDAVERRDVATLVRLTLNNEKLLRLAFKAIFRVRPRGRTKGSPPRPNELSILQRHVFQDALEDYRIIPEIWKAEFQGLTKRPESADETMAPTLLDIIAYKYDFQYAPLESEEKSEKEQFLNYMKHMSRLRGRRRALPP